MHVLPKQWVWTNIITETRWDRVLSHKMVESDMPNIDNAIFLQDGTAIRDANSVLGILKFYLINSEDGPADQCAPAPQTIVGDKIFISHRSVDKKFAETL